MGKEMRVKDDRYVRGCVWNYDKYPGGNPACKGCYNRACLTVNNPLSIPCERHMTQAETLAQIKRKREDNDR